MKQWDIAAGALLILEAGGIVSDLEGGYGYLRSGNVVAGGPKVHKEILKTLQPFLGPNPNTPAD